MTRHFSHQSSTPETVLSILFMKSNTSPTFNFFGCCRKCKNGNSFALRKKYFFPLANFRACRRIYLRLWWLLIADMFPATVTGNYGNLKKAKRCHLKTAKEKKKLGHKKIWESRFLATESSPKIIKQVFFTPIPCTYTSSPLDGMARIFFSTWMRKSMQVIMSGSI